MHRRCARATVCAHACGLVNASETKCGGGVVQRGARVREPNHGVQWCMGRAECAAAHRKKRPTPRLVERAAAPALPGGRRRRIDAESEPKRASSYVCRREDNTKRTVSYARALFAAHLPCFLTKIGNS